MKVLRLIGLIALVRAIPSHVPAHSTNRRSGLAKREAGPVPVSPQPVNGKGLYKRSPSSISTQSVNGGHSFQKRSPAPASFQPRSIPNLHKRCGGFGGYGCWNPCDWGCGGLWNYGIGYGADYGLSGFGYY